MPRRPKRPCSHPGCPELTERRFCEKHAKEENKRYEKYDRDPAVRRRYLVNLYRKSNMKPVDKIIDFLCWTYDYLLLSQYALAYAALLFTNQDSIKAPKGANTNDIDRIISGCENQAWNISYLSNWSTIYGSKEAYSKEFMFATNDYLLKRIFINTHGPNGVNGLLYEVFSKKDYNKILDYIEERMENQVKPDFGKNPQNYFKKLIKKEKEELIKTMGIKDE